MPEQELFGEPSYASSKAQVENGVPMIPKGSRILVRQNKFLQRSVIYIPDTAQARPTTGRVVAIGPSVDPDFVKLGELVVFSLYAGVPITIINAEGEPTAYLSLTPDEIAGELIIDPEKMVVSK